MSGTVIPEEYYRQTSLTCDIEEACNPNIPLNALLILNIIIKFFHLYIYPESHETALELRKISLLFDQFIHRRLGSDVLENNIALRKRLLSCGFALCMLADIAKTAHIFREIAESHPKQSGQLFTGLDIGSGTGILMLAMYVQSRRNGFTQNHIVGIERDTRIAERTEKVLSRLGFGRIIQADAKKPESYGFLENRPVHFISNETLPSAGHSLWKEDFIFINETLFKTLGEQIAKADFFPRSVLTGRNQRQKLVVLNAGNEFHETGDEYPLRLLKPLALELCSEMIPLEDVGQEYTGYISATWQSMLSRRW